MAYMCTEKGSLEIAQIEHADSGLMRLKVSLRAMIERNKGDREIVRLCQHALNHLAFVGQDLDDLALEIDAVDDE